MLPFHTELFNPSFIHKALWAIFVINKNIQQFILFRYHHRTLHHHDRVSRDIAGHDAPRSNPAILTDVHIANNFCTRTYQHPIFYDGSTRAFTVWERIAANGDMLIDYYILSHYSRITDKHSYYVVRKERSGL